MLLKRWDCAFKFLFILNWLNSLLEVICLRKIQPNFTQMVEGVGNQAQTKSGTSFCTARPLCARWEKSRGKINSIGETRVNAATSTFSCKDMFLTKLQLRCAYITNNLKRTVRRVFILLTFNLHKGCYRKTP